MPRSRQPCCDQLARNAADRSFNCITIDGDTSTNDSFILIATGAGNGRHSTRPRREYAALRDAVTDVAANWRK